MSNLQILQEERVNVRDALPVLRSFLSAEREASNAFGKKSDNSSDANHGLSEANLGEDVLLQLQLVQSEMEERAKGRR